MRDFRDLKVWAKAHDTVLDTYRVTESFPAREIYGLTAQMRRAAGSIETNICEACPKPSEAEFIRYLGIALGSSSELKYQFMLSRDLGYMSPNDHSRLEVKIDEVTRVLSGLMKTAQSFPRVSTSERTK